MIFCFMRKLLLIISVFCAVYSCFAQKPNRMNQIRKFNNAYYKSKIRTNTACDVYTESNGDVVKVSFGKEANSVVTIKSKMFMGYTEIYYKNGFLKIEGGWFFCSNVRIVVWKEYDKQGNQLLETDENKKFDQLKLKPRDLLRWMEKQGWINLGTGEGQQSSFSTQPFYISFKPHDGNHAKWYISRVTHSGTEDFVLDAETGNVIDHKNVLNKE